MSAKELCTLTDADLRAIYRRAGQRYAQDKFLVHLAEAVCTADNREFFILRPVALVIIDLRGLAGLAPK